MRLTVISVDPIVKEPNYFHFTLHFDNDGKKLKRKIVSFGTGTVSYKALKDAKEGEKYEVKVEKDDNGNWVWTDVKKLEGDAATAPAMKFTETGKSGNWETAEERARRQVLIVRQSCLAQAVALVDALKMEAVTIEDVLANAADFEAWVMRP